MWHYIDGVKWRWVPGKQEVVHNFLLSFSFIQ